MNLSDKVTVADALAAQRRYPDVPLLLALDFVRSNRCAAGLGALDVRRRGHGFGKQVYRFKEREWKGGLLYVLGVDRPAREEFERLPLGRISPFPIGKELTVKIIRHEPVRKEFRLRIADYNADDRGLIAYYLRDARRELAEATKA